MVRENVIHLKMEEMFGELFGEFSISCEVGWALYMSKCWEFASTSPSLEGHGSSKPGTPCNHHELFM
jgi:hypothetical protein